MASSAMAFAAVFAAGSVLAADAKKEDEEVKKAEATEMAEAPKEEMAEEAMAEEVMEEAPPPAWVVGVSGYMEQWAGVSDVDGHADNDGITDFQSDTEFNIDAKIEADNGMTFRAQIQVEGNAGNNIDESYLSVSGGFGDIRLGAEDDVHSAMHFGVVDVGIGLNHGDVNAWIPGVSNFSTSGWKADRKGLIYFSPRMQGLQVGVSYSGDAGNEAGGTTHNDHDSWAASANYTGEMAGTSLSISVGHYNAGTTDEQMVDDYGVNGLCGMTKANTAGGLQAFSAAGNQYCNATNLVAIDMELDAADFGGSKGVTHVGDVANESHYVLGTSTRDMADDSTFTNFGLRVGVGSFGFSFAYAMADSGAYKVVNTPLYYYLGADEITDADFTATRVIADSAGTALTTTDVDHDNDSNTAAISVIVPVFADGDEDNAVSGKMFNLGMDMKAGGTDENTDAAAANRVPEYTQSVMKDKAGESTTMSAGVSFSEGPLGVSLGWSQEERDDNTEADAVMFSASYTLAPGVAARGSIFQAEDEANGVDGTAFVGGITLSF